MQGSSPAWQRGERAQPDALGFDERADSRVAQRCQLGDPFMRVHGVQIGCGCRMTTELGDSLGKVAKEVHECVDRDGVRQGSALIALPVELPAVPHDAAASSDRWIAQLLGYRVDG